MAASYGAAAPPAPRQRDRQRRRWAARAVRPRGGRQALGDPLAQRLGHLVAAALADDHPQLGLEVEHLEARAAVVEVVADLDAPGVGQLAVEERVQRRAAPLRSLAS